jgi:hypothetical protein
LDTIGVPFRSWYVAFIASCPLKSISVASTVDLTKLSRFDWDAANREKNWDLHGVSWSEAEEVFFNQPILLYPEPVHSESEDRFYVIGRTGTDRHLFVVFTIRKNKIRIISARDMAKKERRIYDEASQENPKL